MDRAMLQYDLSPGQVDYNPRTKSDSYHALERSKIHKIFMLYYDQLYKYGHRISPNEEIIKDCIQDLFVILLRQSDVNVKVINIRSYLLCSMKRLMIKQIRKQKILHERDRRYCQKNVVPYYLDADESKDDNENQFVYKKAILEAIDSLSHREKEVVCLKYYDNHSNDEIAQIMNINVQSVYNHSHNAIRKIKKFVSASKL